MFDSTLKIDYYFKIGGSLMRNNDKRIFELVTFLETLSNNSNIVISTGSLNLPSITKNALNHIVTENSEAKEFNKILLRDCVGNYFSELSPKFQSVDDIQQVKLALKAKKIPILRQSKLISMLAPFDIVDSLTGDSTAAYFAGLLAAKKFIILTDVDGIYKNWKKETPYNELELVRFITTEEVIELGSSCIDSQLAVVLNKFNLDSWIFNGQNIENLYKFFIEEKYLESKFTSISIQDVAKQRNYNLNSVLELIEKQYLEYTIVFNEKNKKNIRFLKKEALDSYYNNFVNWNDLSSFEKNNWENKLSFTLSNLMERIGVLVFSNIINSDIFYGILCDQILEDWLICSSWVFEYRTKTIDAENLLLKRRYAEWLALHSYIYIKAKIPNLSTLKYYESLYGNESQLLTKYYELTEACKI